MNPQTLLFPDGSSPQQLWIKQIPDEELNTLLTLSNDERGLFTTLRFYALTYNGLSADVDLLWADIRHFCGLSHRKFLRLLPRVLTKFCKMEDKFYFYRDEDRVQSSREKVIKSRSFGKLGAERRWRNESGTNQNSGGFQMATPSATPMLTDQTDQTILDRPEGTEVLTNGREEPPPPSSAEVEVFPSNSSTPLSSPEPVTDSEVQALEQHCRKLNLPPPGRKLCDRLKQKFHPVPIAQFVQQLPRFENQNSPGLWADPALTPRILAEEAERQKNPPPAKKPVKAEPKSPYINVWDLEASKA
jgi:hypothetical protein